MADPAAPADLARRLGLVDAAAIFVGIILGSGIFFAPAGVAAVAPGAAGVWLWLAGGLAAAAGALCYAECGARMPRTGGFYVYCRAVYGEPVAFVGGWAALLVTYPASMAAIALVFGHYLGEAVPALAGHPTLAAAGALVAVGALNVAGVRAGALTQRGLTAAKVGVLALLCLAAVLAGGRGAAAARAPVTLPPVQAAALLGAFIGVLFTYDGWSDVTLIAGEIRDPGRNLGRAVAVGIAVLVALYAAVQLAVTALLPPARAGASDRVLAEAVQVGLGRGAGVAVAWLVVVSTFGSLHGVALTASRLGFAMARDGVFPAAFGALHPRLGTPARALAALIAAAVCYGFAGGLRGLLGYFTFSVWIFYGLIAGALLVLRRRRVGEPLPWRAPGGPAAPILVLLTAAVMTGSLLWQSPWRSAGGLAMFGVGFAAYYGWRAVRRRA
ncbi:MAG TPA: amino acid permease [Polyangia bacterium]|jgi:APA family basic amino acid/polyamine antiporter